MMEIRVAKSPAFAREPADGPIRGGKICDESSIPSDRRRPRCR